jgi:NAD(P)-dependent dehydrogenase (short-subunit alcohol dehydrogenase family)
MKRPRWESSSSSEQVSYFVLVSISLALVEDRGSTQQTMLLSTSTDNSRRPLSVGAITVAVLFVAVLFALIIVPSTRPFEGSDLKVLATNLTVVISGANSGLGFGTVEHLARAGTAKTIVLACRNNARCEHAKKKAASLLPKQSTTRLVTATLDLASTTSIQAFAEELPMLLASRNYNSDRDDGLSTNELPVIDVLINNAGIFASSADQKFIGGVEEHMHVNYLGHVLMTHLLWPTLERSNARIVSVSSISAFIPSNPLAGWFQSSNKEWSDSMSLTSGLFRYFRSKRANLSFANQLHHQRVVSNNNPQSAGVSSVASHPGYTRSEIWSNGAKIFPSFCAKLIEWNPLLSMSSSEGSLTQLWAALDRRQVPSGSYVGPQWWLYGKPIPLGPIGGQPTFPYHHAPLYQEELLWQRTMEVLGIEEFGRPNTATSLS